MFSFLGKLFGSDKALEKTIDTASSLLDEAFYTDQEAAADKSEARAQAQGMVIEWTKSTTGSRLARRLLALGITGTWLSLYLFSTLCGFLAIWYTESADNLLASSALIDARIDGMTGAVMLILGFYFAAPYMGELVGGAMNRFSKTGNNSAS